MSVRFLQSLSTIELNLRQTNVFGKCGGKYAFLPLEQGQMILVSISEEIG